MYCLNCGQELPDEASFCWKCGRPQKAEVQAQVEQPRWETCEIKHTVVGKNSIFGAGTLKFVAVAIGPNGRYWAAESARFPTAENSEDMPSAYHPSRPDEVALEEAREALDGLITILSKEGWDHSGMGEYWYNHQFRRRVGAPVWEWSEIVYETVSTKRAGLFLCII